MFSTTEDKSICGGVGANCRETHGKHCISVNQGLGGCIRGFIPYTSYLAMLLNHNQGKYRKGICAVHFHPHATLYNVAAEPKWLGIAYSYLFLSKSPYTFWRNCMGMLLTSFYLHSTVKQFSEQVHESTYSFMHHVIFHTTRKQRSPRVSAVTQP